MIKIKVSYSEEKELKEVMELLTAKISKVKKPKEDQGPYKKAYIELNN
ncbi:hypothetical protein [Aminipila sp.]|nr:hypothetical protein [Aminipila sp.]